MVPIYEMELLIKENSFCAFRCPEDRYVANGLLEVRIHFADNTNLADEMIITRARLYIQELLCDKFIVETPRTIIKKDLGNGCRGYNRVELIFISRLIST